MRNRSPILALAFGLVALSFSVGCSAIREDAPELTLVHLKVQDVQLFETAATFTVRVTNVTPEAASFEGGAVSVYVDGRKIGRGVINQTIDVPGLDSKTVDGKIYMSNLAMLRRLQSLMNSGEMSYRLKGVLYQRAGAGLRKVRTERDGMFNMDEFQAAPDEAPQTNE